MIHPIEIIKFPAGEVQARVPDVDTDTICARITNSDHLIATIQAISAIRKNHQTLNLICPYLPYSRQDKIHFKGETASVFHVCNMLVGDYGQVRLHTIDCHTTQPIRGVVNYGMDTWLPLGQISQRENICLVWPDKSARARAKKLIALISRLIQFQECSFEKVRNPETGKIESISPIGEIPGATSYILIDDICDGGGTFLPIADQLPSGAERILCTSHAMYSQGKEKLLETFDELWTTDSFFTGAHERIIKCHSFDLLMDILEVKEAIGINI